MAQNIIKLRQLEHVTMQVTLITTREYKIREWLFRKLIFVACWLACYCLGCKLEWRAEKDYKDA